MAEHSTIEWTDATWNPITGCAVVSPGCTNCYAMKLAGTRLAHHPSRAGLTRETKAGPVWTGEMRLNEEWLTQPLTWRRPRRIFVCAHGDLFAEGVPDEWIDRVFAVMALAPQHTFQVLTKRAARMRRYLTDTSLGLRVGGKLMRAARGNAGAEALVVDLTHRLAVSGQGLANVWLGVSAEDQARADERVPDLLATPAAIRFVSAEPLLGRIKFLWSWLEDIDWIIVGGESGNGARPMHPDWAREIRDYCAATGTAFFFKQWGQCLPEGQIAAATGRAWSGSPYVRMDKKGAGRLLDGRTHDAMPEGAR